MYKSNTKPEDKTRAVEIYLRHETGITALLEKYKVPESAFIGVWEKLGNCGIRRVDHNA